jgi:TP901 family phage tail tape measure protein
MPFRLGQGFVDVDMNPRKALSQAKTLKTKMGRITGRIASQVGRSLRVAMTLAASAIAVATNEAAKFEFQMQEVNTLLDATAEQMKELSLGALELSKTLGQPIERVTRGLYQAISAGIPRENVLKFLEVAGKAAVAGVSDVDTAVDGLTSVMNAYSLETEDAGRVADKFFTTIRIGKTIFPELAHGVGRVAPLAKAAGVSLEEMFGMLAALTKQGLKTDQATTGLRAIFQQMISPNEKLAQSLGLIEAEMGVTSWRSLGLQKTLALLSEMFGNNNEEIGKLFPNVRGLNAVFAVVGDNTGAVARDIDAVTKSAGEMNQAFSEMEDTAVMQFRKLKASVKAAIIQFGQGFLPLVDEIKEAMTELVGTQDWEEWGRVVAETIQGVIMQLKELRDWVKNSADPTAKFLRKLIEMYDRYRKVVEGTHGQGNRFNRVNPFTGKPLPKTPHINFGKPTEDEVAAARARRLGKAQKKVMEGKTLTDSEKKIVASNEKAGGEIVKKVEDVKKLTEKQIKLMGEQLRQAKEAEEEAEAIIRKWEEFGNELLPKFEMPFDEAAQAKLAEELRKDRAIQFTGIDQIFREFATTGQKTTEKQLEIMKKQLEMHKKELEQNDQIIIEIEKVGNAGSKFSR